MKLTTQKICHGVFAVLAVVFAMKAFLYGGSTFHDPNDSPLFQSTLDRALANFKQSDLVLGGRVVPGASLSNSTAMVAGLGQSQDHAGHNHQLLDQGGAGQTDHGCKDVKAGLQFMQQGKFKEAAASFEVAVPCLSDDPCVQNYLGMAYDKMGETEKSKQAYQKAAMLQKAQAGTGVQNPDQVLGPDVAPRYSPLLPPATVPAPGQSQEQAGLGLGYQPPGQGGAGLVHAPQAQTDHGCKDVKAGLQFMQQGKYKEAAASFEFAVQEHLSSDPCVQNYLGMAYDKMGETEKSKQAYQKAAILQKAQ